MSHAANPKAALYTTALDAARRAGLWRHERPVDKHGRLTTSPTSHDGLEWKELLRKFVKHTGRQVTAQAVSLEIFIHNLSPSSTPCTDPQLLDGISTLRNSPASTLSASPTSSAPVSNQDRDSATVILAQALLLAGKPAEALDSLSHINGGKGGVGGVTLEDGKGEGYDLVLRVAASVINGRAHKALGNSEAEREAYIQAARTFKDVEEILNASSSPAGRSGSRTGSSTGEAELYRWGEEAVHVAANLLASSGDTTGSIALHRQYLSLPLHSSSKLQQSLLSFRHLLSTQSPNSLPSYWSDLSLVNRSEERIVRRETTLPRAGEVNERYLRLLDSVAQGWRRGGATHHGAQEVINICYSALTHTFQSQRLLRHVIHALSASSQHVEAGKAVKLYVALWDKARETDAIQVAKDVRRFRSRRPSLAGARPDTLLEKDGEKAGNEEEVEVMVDVDSDRDFIDTVLVGARVFTKYLAQPEEGVRLAKRARAVWDEEKDDTLARDKELEARIEAALGITLGALTELEAEPPTRSRSQETALSHLLSAHTLSPSSPQIAYSLAYALAEARRTEDAVEVAQKAVSLFTTPHERDVVRAKEHGKEAGRREAWHMLGLLVGAGAGKDWGASLQVLETAMDEDLDDEGEERGSPPDGVNSLDFAASSAHPDTTTPATATVLQPSSPVNLPSSNAERPTLSPSTPISSSPYPYPSSTPTEQLIAAAQLRMTKNAVIEVMEGPEAAVLDQQSLFTFFREEMEVLRESCEGGQGGSESLTTNGTSTTITSNGGTATATPTISVGTGANGHHHSHTSGVRRAASILSRKKSVKKEHPPELNASGSLAVPALPSGVSSLSRVNTPTGSFSNLSIVPDSGPASSAFLATSPRIVKLLTDIWLLSAASYRRAGKLEDARGAIQEAELLNADDPDMWHQYALYNLALSRLELARTCLMKALAFSPTHIPSLVQLARVYLSSSPPEPALAEGLLQVTKREAWDVPEAWFELSRCYKLTGRREKERDALVWALELQETRGVRSWHVLPREV